MIGVGDSVAPQSAIPATAPPILRCLWIARELPFPMNTGDRIYTGNLALAFAQSETELTFIGLEPACYEDIPDGWPVHWEPVPGRKMPNWRALLSTQPLVSAAFAVRGFRHRLAEILTERWDVIVIDHYGCAWVLDMVRKAARSRVPHPVLVHISQNHEESLSGSLYQSYEGSWFNRAILYQNHLKIRHWERRLASEVDLVTAITAEDRTQFEHQAPAVATLVLTPGYSGPVASERSITSATPKRVVMVGSFRWLVKQQNLRGLLEAGDRRFHAAGIALDVIGDVPEELRREFEPRLKATTFHGFVDDVRPIFSAARMALVPEVIGGGFKLKFLDYIFCRVPVATISDAAAGLPTPLRQYLIDAPTLEALVDRVIAEIDDVERLNALQQQAFVEAAPLFDWRDRGRELQQAAMKILIARRAASMSGAGPIDP